MSENPFQRMIRDELFRKKLEKAGFRIIAEITQKHMDELRRKYSDDLRRKYPPGHCYHLHGHDCEKCQKDPCACEVPEGSVHL